MTFYLFLFALLAVVVGWYSFSPRSATVAILFQPKPTSSVMGAEITPQVKVSSKTVIKVIDGDTIMTNDGEKIRYIGMNAPEIGQPFAKEATDLNTKLVLGKHIQLVFDAQRIDQYGRDLAYIYIQNRLINAEIVKNGLAVADSFAPNILHQNEINTAEELAKNHCVGMWQSYCSAGNTSCIKIANVHYDAQGVDDSNLNDEWVLLQNNCTEEVTMQNWFLKDTSSSNIYSFKNNTISAKQMLKIHSGCGQDTVTDLYWKCPAVTHAIWNNSGDEAMLFDSHGELLSAYKY